MNCETKARWVLGACIAVCSSVSAQEAADAPPADVAAPPASIPVDAAAAPAAEPAAEDAGPHNRFMDEIIVTAQKREEKLQDVPIAISAFSGDNLVNLGVTDTRDLARLVPGFNANESGRNTTLFTLRGVGFADTTYTASNTVGTYIDEVNLPFAVMTRGANLDIERVEVLKGPQGTLYGRNTTGGLINYIAKAPTADYQAGTLTSFGSYETLESENFVSGPLTDTLRGRIAFKVVNEQQGWQQSNVRGGSERLGEQKKFSGRGSLDWRPNDDLLVRFRAEGWLDKSDPTAPQAVGVIPGNPFVGALGLNPEIQSYPYLYHSDDPTLADWPHKKGRFPGHLDDSFHMESVKSIWNISDTMSLTGIVSHLQQKADGSPQLQGYNITATDLITTANIKTNALEVRLADTWWDRFYWSVGVSLSHDKALESEFLDVTNAGALFAVTNGLSAFDALQKASPDTAAILAGLGLQIPLTLSGPITDEVVLDGKPNIKQRAIFVNTDTKITDHLSLNAGVRYTENDQKFFFCASEPTTANQDSPAFGLSNLFTLLSGLAVAEYAVTNPGQPGRFSVVQPGECFSLGVDGNNDPIRDKLNQQNTSGRLALSWKTDSDDLYFVSVSRGFKSGGFPVLNPARQRQLVPVVQEELLAYEVGAKLEFMDGHVSTGLGSFWYDYKNKQLLTKIHDEIFGPLPILQNAPKSHIYGFELEARIFPVDGLTIALAASYIKTEIDKFRGFNSLGEEQDFKGLPFNFAPETQLSTIIDYTFPVGDGLEMGFAGDYYHTGGTYGAIDQNPLLRMEPYDLFGARVHVGQQGGKWTATVFGRNLTNELANQGSNSFSEAVTRAVAKPRTWGVSLQYLWD